MVDVVDATTRSRMMSGIRGRHTKPELLIRKALHGRGFRYRLHAKALPGKPDLLLPKHQAALFVHGCFWHRHDGCRFATTPATRSEFWAEKFSKNMSRDSLNLEKLKAAGWRIGIVWECAIKDRGADQVGEAVGQWLLSSSPFLSLPS